MRKLPGFLLPIVFVLAGATLIFFGIRRPVSLVIDGVPQVVVTRAFTAGSILQSAGLRIEPLDQVNPKPDQWIGWNQTILINRAHQFQIWVTPGGLTSPLKSPERFAENVLLQAGMRLFPGDRLFVNGQPLKSGVPLAPQPSTVIEVLRAMRYDLVENGTHRVLFSSAASIAGVIWQGGQTLSSLDTVSPPAGSRPAPGMSVTLQRALPLHIRLDGQDFQAKSSAATVGQALEDAGFALEGMDFSIPGEEQPLPANRTIRVVRVREEVQLQQTEIPFKSETVQDAETDLDQRRIVQAGRVGIKVTRLRVRYENGTEVTRKSEASWVAQEPANEKVGIGTRAAVYHLNTPGGTIDYYRSIEVYATSYSPCESGGSGNSRCYNYTSSGLPVKRGVIGVTSAWYRLFAGQQVYIPGYGKAIIADIGAGIPGKRWIDLGFSDSDLEPWHQNVTLYFLTPIPANVPLSIP